MEIVLRTNGAEVSETMRRKVEQMVLKAALRLPRAVDALVRLEEDGRMRRVEVVLHAPRHKPVVATGEGRYFGPAVASALHRLARVMAREKRTPRARSSVARRTAPSTGD